MFRSERTRPAHALRAVRRRCCASDPWRATSSVRSNLDFGSDSRLHVGADCAIAIWLRTPGDVWLGRALSLPAIHQLARLGYDRFADLLYAWNRWQRHAL